MQGIGEREQIGLYFHIPFCSKKCPYCHFYVVPYREDREKDFLDALEKEWQKRRKMIGCKEVFTLYFGGGTPSLLTPLSIRKLIEMTGATPREVTLEANPETISLDRMIAFKKAGVNRLSIGVQSLVDGELTVLGRRHGSSKAIDSIKIAHDAGFENISIDLMFELPGQTLRSWEHTLERAVSLPITHLSLYNLTFEPHTPFHLRKKELIPLLPEEEIKKTMLDMAINRFKEAGLQRYEISAFAKEGFVSLHNTGYWLARPFLGLGPSAFSFWEKKRFRNVCSLNKWAECLAQDLNPCDFEEQLSQEDSFNELLAVQLRLVGGVNRQAFEDKNGPTPPRTKNAIARLITEGLLIEQKNQITLTEKGLLFYDSVAEELV